MAAPVLKFPGGDEGREPFDPGMSSQELAKWADNYVNPPSADRDAIGKPPAEGLGDRIYLELFMLGDSFDWKIPVLPGSLAEWDAEVLHAFRIIGAHIAAARIRKKVIDDAVESSKRIQRMMKEQGFGGMSIHGRG